MMASRTITITASTIISALEPSPVAASACEAMPSIPDVDAVGVWVDVAPPAPPVGCPSVGLGVVGVGDVAVDCMFTVML